MTKIFEEINVKFPKTDKKIEKAYKFCEERKKFVQLSNENFIEHLELAKDDLNTIKTDFDNKNWRWVVTKSYYAIFHATNALLVKKQGFFSKDHLCAIIALKKNNIIPENFYKEMREVYERFSDIFGFAIIFEARKLSQYDTRKWKELTEEDAKIAFDFSKKFVSFVEESCQ